MKQIPHSQSEEEMVASCSVTKATHAAVVIEITEGVGFMELSLV